MDILLLRESSRTGLEQNLFSSFASDSLLGVLNQNLELFPTLTSDNQDLLLEGHLLVPEMSSVINDVTEAYRLDT
jgi:hypothetical protein